MCSSCQNHQHFKPLNHGEHCTCGCHTTLVLANENKLDNINSNITNEETFLYEEKNSTEIFLDNEEKPP